MKSNPESKPQLVAFKLATHLHWDIANLVVLLGRSDKPSLPPYSQTCRLPRQPE